MKIATWNMDHWRRSADLRARAWDYLRNHVRPDVALLQEANPTGQFPGIVHRTAGIHDDRGNEPKDLGWGSAVVSFGPSLRPIDSAVSPFWPEPNPVLRTFSGSVAVAEILGSEPDKAPFSVPVIECDSEFSTRCEESTLMQLPAAACGKLGRGANFQQSHFTLRGHASSHSSRETRNPATSAGGAGCTIPR